VKEADKRGEDDEQTPHSMDRSRCATRTGMGWTMLPKVDRTVSDSVNWRGVDEQGAGR
jgi:hypothetical protein